MPLSREARDTLTRRQANLSGLTKHPSWEEYVAEGKREIERHKKRAQFLALNPEGTDQRLCDYLRGYIDAVRWSITMPEVAERNLVRYLRSQGLEIEEENEAHV
jgi:hypothetical protein